MSKHLKSAPAEIDESRQPGVFRQEFAAALATSIERCDGPVSGAEGRAWQWMKSCVAQDVRLLAAGSTELPPASVPRNIANVMIPFDWVERLIDAHLSVVSAFAGDSAALAVGYEL